MMRVRPNPPLNDDAFLVKGGGGFTDRAIYLRAGDLVKIIMMANMPVNLYAVDDLNFALFQQGQKFTFWGTQVPTSYYARAFKAPFEGPWHFIVHNEQNRAASGSLSLFLGGG